ncbi:MAG: sensor histidine kinase [Granulosicoccaceae bacterium]
MQLRTHIFLSVTLALLVPMSVLILAATGYSERLYRKEVDQELFGSLATVLAEMDRRLVYERDTFRAFATAPPLENYFPVMQAATEGNIHKEFFERSDQINNFFEGFQNVVPSLNTIRILDTQGNTLVKVRVGQRTPPLFDGYSSFPYAEEELDDPEYLEKLLDLPPNEVSVTLLAQTEAEDIDTSPPMLDYIMPIKRDQQFIGYLVANMLGEQIDRILDFAPRPVNGRLLIAEINSEQAERNGIILYDDARNLRFSDKKTGEFRLQNYDNGQLYDIVQTEQEGKIVSRDGREVIYFVEYLPYPNLLVHWILAVRVNAEDIAAPFNRIRTAILLLSVVALLFGMVLVRYVSTRVASPLTELVRSMRAYASGERDQRVQSKGADEIRMLGESFNDMADTLNTADAEREHAQHILMQHAKLASIGQLAAGIGHEINNPLNNILTLSKFIERAAPEGNDRIHKDIQSLREETLRASEIVKGVLNFARQVPPAFTQFDVETWVNDTLALVRQEAFRKHISLQTHIDYTGMLHGDRSQLQQVLINLLINAIQASVEDSTVTIQVRKENESLYLAVSDSGIGIDERDMDRIFDPFFTSKDVGEGNGLGLSVSLGIVEQHDGELWLENNETGGVTAIVTLPLVHADNLPVVTEEDDE